MTAFDQAWGLVKNFRPTDRRTCHNCKEDYIRPEGPFGSPNWGYCPECTPKVMEMFVERGQSEQEIINALENAKHSYRNTEIGRNNPNRDENVCNACGAVFVRGDNAFGNRKLTACRDCIDKVAPAAYKWLHPKEGEETGPVSEFDDQMEGME